MVSNQLSAQIALYAFMLMLLNERLTQTCVCCVCRMI